ncbi:MAG: PAS domain S-box protein [Bacteroidota bacterium]
MPDSSTDLAQQLQAIIDTAIDGIITIDAKGVVETLNPAAADLFGYAPEEVLGNNVKMLMPAPYKAEHDGYIHRYQKTKKPHIIGIGREVNGQKKDGTIFPFRLAVSEVILNDRVIYTGIIHDLTEVKNAEQAIKELNVELEQKVKKRTIDLEKTVNKLLSTNTSLQREIKEKKAAEEKLRVSESELRMALTKEKELSELKSRFVSMASHEFRTPLTSILSSAALIGRYDKTEQQANREKHINRIKSSVSNLTGILNDFLSLSKLEEGRVEVYLSELNLGLLCQEVIEDTKSLLKSKQTINHTVHGDNPVVIVDERILRNILFNLVSNAIKYSEEDINCSIHFEKNYYQFDIEDRGIGIPIEDQKYLFSRFFRAGNVTNIQGTGLGLNIVKRYVEILGGEISFVSEHEVGTTFSVKIPYINLNKAT